MGGQELAPACWFEPSRRLIVLIVVWSWIEDVTLEKEMEKLLNASVKQTALLQIVHHLDDRATCAGTRPMRLEKRKSVYL